MSTSYIRDSTRRLASILDGLSSTNASGSTRLSLKESSQRLLYPPPVPKLASTLLAFT